MNQVIKMIKSNKNFDGTLEFTNHNGKKNSVNLVAFGSGKEILVLIPGLSDGLTTSKGKLFLLKYSYRLFSKEYRVLIISRVKELFDGYSLNDMAKDYLSIFNHLEYNKVNIWGLSMGGMIAQHIALINPSIINRMCLDVTTAKTSEYSREILNDWIQYANNKDKKKLLFDTIEKTYIEKDLKKYKLIFPFLNIITKIKSFDRFIFQAKACQNHNVENELHDLNIPCLVSGGDTDKILGPEAVERLHENIRGSFLKIYKGYGHSSFENHGHNQIVLQFFREGTLNC